MKYRAEFDLDRSYFEECFDQWLRHRSKYRRWQVRMSVILILFGLLLMIRWPAWFSIVVAMIGVVELVEFFLYRHRWIGQRIQARLDNPNNHIQIEIGDFGVYQKGPTSEGTISWAGVKKVFQTEKGMFLAFGDGMSIYIPSSSVSEPEFKNYVAGKVKGDS